jgi:hypothetical protein
MTYGGTTLAYEYSSSRKTWTLLKRIPAYGDPIHAEGSHVVAADKKFVTIGGQGIIKTWQ